MTESEFDFSKAQTLLLHFWALSNEEKVKCLPKNNIRVKYYVSDSSSYTTNPLKYLAIESTSALDVVLENPSGRPNGVARELAFLLTEMLTHHNEAWFWRLGRPAFAIYEDYYWFVLNRLAKEALSYLGEDKKVVFPIFEEMLIGGRARKNYKNAITQRKSNRHAKHC